MSCRAHRAARLRGILAALALGGFVILAPADLWADDSSPPPAAKIEQHGAASYYGDSFNGRKTADGGRFNENAQTAASPVLPLGSRAKVTNEKNGRAVEVRINDRGPYVDGRIIDLSRGAARKLGMEKEGVAPVRVEERPTAQPTARLRKEVENEAARQQRCRLSERQRAVRSRRPVQCLGASVPSHSG